MDGTTRQSAMCLPPRRQVVKEPVPPRYRGPGGITSKETAVVFARSVLVSRPALSLERLSDSEHHQHGAAEADQPAGEAFTDGARARERIAAAVVGMVQRVDVRGERVEVVLRNLELAELRHDPGADA